MSNPVWPATLPQLPERSGWSGGPMDQRAYFKPEFGPPIMRRRSTAAVMLYNTMFTALSMEQRLVFAEFYEDDLAGGTLPFEWIEPMTSTNRLWVIGEGDPPYSFSTVAWDWHDLSMKLIRLPRLP